MVAIGEQKHHNKSYQQVLKQALIATFHFTKLVERGGGPKQEFLKLCHKGFIKPNVMYGTSQVAHEIIKNFKVVGIFLCISTQKARVKNLGKTHLPKKK